MPGSERAAVVIVEDDHSMCQALDRILRLGGFDRRMYCSAEALLDAGPNGEPVCMILDIQLPGMGGFALHERLAARGTLPPVIFITAFDEPDARVRAERIDAAVFLPKPFAGRALLDTIRRVIVRRGDSQRGA